MTASAPTGHCAMNRATFLRAYKKKKVVEYVGYQGIILLQVKGKTLEILQNKNVGLNEH